MASSGSKAERFSHLKPAERAAPCGTLRRIARSSAQFGIGHTCFGWLENPNDLHFAETLVLMTTTSLAEVTNE